jgi:hypothetical protein
MVRRSVRRAVVCLLLLFACTPSAHAGKAQKLLRQLKTVDGAGSGLDADTLQGKPPSAFQPAGTTTSSGGAVVTFYGLTECPPGWTLAYVGSVIYVNVYAPSIMSDGICWADIPRQPAPDINGYNPEFLVIAECAVCVR